MSQTYITKTVTQHSGRPLSTEELAPLCEIARDYRTVKNVVFERYGGIRSLSKLYPGYTVQNEMTAGGLRRELGLPSVYFYLALFDALGCIKSEWTRLKKCILKNIRKNENFNDMERHYLRFVLKTDPSYAAVLNEKEVILSTEYANIYERLRAQVDAKKLNDYLRRQTRKYHRILHSAAEDGFAVSKRAYRYADHGIYVTTKKKRDRVFIPLTDNNRYENQLYIKLFPQEKRLEVKAPIQRKVKRHEDYRSEVGIALGMETMLTTDQGHEYGTALGEYQRTYAQWIRRQGIVHKHSADTGRKKYTAEKNRRAEALHSYINCHLNRFLAQEKPAKIYMVKLPKQESRSGSKEINHAVSMWQKGYIRGRLLQKCAEQAIEAVEVMGKDISRECSRCGSPGSKKDGIFWCEACGFREKEKQNTAANASRRGQEGKVVF
ncbi:MAG: hypothetical protein HFI39_10685 [Lachnospiraceae bacterium]|nr:hypothetical protein [Lachnospiraceae bacterium]